MNGDEKKSVRLTIYNQTFSLRVSGDGQDLVRAAQEVDELMYTIARSGNMDATRVALLACLHLQDRIHALEAEAAGMKTSVEERTRALAGLLDDVIAS